MICISTGLLYQENMILHIVLVLLSLLLLRFRKGVKIDRAQHDLHLCQSNANRNQQRPA